MTGISGKSVKDVCILLHRSLLALFILVTLARAVGLVLPLPVSAGLALVLLASALPLVKSRTLLIAVMLTAACGGLVATGAPVRVIERGLGDALTFAAYLPVLQMLRVIVGELPAMARARDAFGALPQKGRDTGALVLATGLGSVLTTGAHALIAPLLPKDAPEPLRRQMALISLRGISFSAFWSPFAVSVAFGTQYMPETASATHTLMGLALAGVIFLLAWRMEGGGSLLAGWRAVLPILPHCVLAAGATVALVAITTMNPLDAVVVATLPLGILALLWQAPSSSVAVTRTVWSGLARGADEVLLITLALCLGRLIEASPGLIALAAPFVSGLPVPLILTAIFAAVIFGGLIGLHPMITSAVMIGVLRAGGGGLHPTLMMQAIQAAWGFAVTVSPSGVTLIVATMMFDVPHQRLVISRNILFVGLSSLCLIVMLSLINAGLSLS